jgi:protein HIRA/HIR1
VNVDVLRSGHGLGKIFGSNEVNVENWRSVKRLVGHENGITY